MAEWRFPSVRSPLVGRDSELDRMQAVLDAVMAGAGRLLLISGEPGIGKTRLVEELAALAVDQGALVAWGCVDDAEGAPPYSPWTHVLDDIFEGCEEQVIGEALGPWALPVAAIVPRVKDYVAEIAPPPPLDPAAARFRLHEAIVGFLVAIGGRRRLVVILEDMHWADVASLELTRFAAARLSVAPLLLVVTYRSVDAGGSQPFHDVLGSLAREPALERVALEGLTEFEVGRFMAQTIGLRPRPAVVATVHARTEGNPFFVAELARLLLGEGQLGIGGAPSHDAVPVGVRDVVRRRLGRMPEQTNELLVLGAVLGREFDLAMLAATAELDQGDALDGIEPALSAGIITEAADAVGRLRFSHALIRETVYSELSGLRRATLHGRIGAILEQRQGPAQSQLAELAWHFFHAAPVVGSERGLRYALDAADAAQAAHAYERAEDELRRALTVIGIMPAGPVRWERELGVQNRLAGLLTMTRGHAAPEVGEACARANALCREVGETDDLLATINGMANFHLARGDLSIVAELAVQLLTIGAAGASTTWLVAGHLFEGAARLHLGRIVAAQASFAAACDLARSSALSAGDADVFRQHPLVLSLGSAGLCAWLRGAEAEGVSLDADAVRVADDLGHPFSLVFAVFMATHLDVLRASGAEAKARAERGLELCAEFGFPMFAPWFTIFRSWAMSQQGHHEQALADIADAVAAERVMGDGINTVFFLGVLADVERASGNAARALASTAEALAVLGRVEDRLYESEVYRRRGELLAALGPELQDEAVDWLRRAVSTAATQGAVPFWRGAEAALAAFERTATATSTAPDRAASNLSRRESEILALVGRGLTDKVIARELMISVATVRSHLDRIRDKTGRRRRAELTRLAIDLGLTTD